MMATRVVMGLCFSCILVQVARSQIRVLSPQSVGSKYIEGSTATFGAPFYGDRVLGRLVYGESKGQLHCTDSDYDLPDAQPVGSGSSESGGGALIDIFIVRRGSCSFTTKVKVAARKGAHAVLIVDREDSTYTASDLKRIIVADDGYGGDISIPSILISKDDGNRLIAAAKTSLVVIEMKWNIPSNHAVQMDLWMSSGSQESLKFLKDFASRRKVLNAVVNFQPHYAVFSLPKTDPSVYNELCTDTTGEFCAEDPDGSGSVTGRQVLEEDVRQLCIHELTKVDMNSAHKVMFAEKYWDYVSRFPEECPLTGKTEDRRFGWKCAENLMDKLGIETRKVQTCIADTKTRKLQYERENKAWSPRALRINGWRFNGILDADLVTRAICDGFIEQPGECKNLLAKRDPFQDFVQNTEIPQGGISFSTLILSLLLVGIVGFLGMQLYKKSLTKEWSLRIKEEVMLEVRDQMAHYQEMQCA